MITFYFSPGSSSMATHIALNETGASFEARPLTLQKGTRTPDFLKINPNGKVPALQFPDGRVLFESNAIIFYLAQGTPYWPGDRWDQGQAMQWMNFEQYSHEPTIAVVRADAPYRTLKEFIEEARRKPGALKQAGGSVTAIESMTGLLLQSATGAKWKVRRRSPSSEYYTT